MTTTSAAKLPILNTEQLAPTWRSAEPLLVIGARTELDQAAAAIFAALVEMHGVPARVECAEMLTACNIANLDLSGVALMCVSSVDMKTPAHIHFAARRLRSRAPHAKLLLGLWSAKDDETGAELKDVVGTDDFARTFHQAAAIILQRATTDQGGAKAPARASAALASNLRAENISAHANLRRMFEFCQHEAPLNHWPALHGGDLVIADEVLCESAPYRGKCLLRFNTMCDL